MKASILLLLLSPIGSTSAAAGFVTNLVPARTMSPSSYALTMELPKPENWEPFKQAKLKIKLIKTKLNQLKTLRQKKVLIKVLINVLSNF